MWLSSFTWTLHISGIVTYCWVQHLEDKRLFTLTLTRRDLLCFLCIYHVGVVSFFCLFPELRGDCDWVWQPGHVSLQPGPTPLGSTVTYCWSQKLDHVILLPSLCFQGRLRHIPAPAPRWCNNTPWTLPSGVIVTHCWTQHIIGDMTLLHCLDSAQGRIVMYYQS